MSNAIITDMSKLEIGMYAEYDGDTRWGRPFMPNAKYKIANIRRDNYGDPVSVGLENDSEIYWTSVNSIRNVTQETFDIDKVFTDAAGGPVAVLQAELDRKRQEVAELEAALATLKKYTV